MVGQVRRWEVLLSPARGRSTLTSSSASRAHPSLIFMYSHHPQYATRGRITLREGDCVRRFCARPPHGTGARVARHRHSGRPPGSGENYGFPGCGGARVTFFLPFPLIGLCRLTNFNIAREGRATSALGELSMILFYFSMRYNSNLDYFHFVFAIWQDFSG